VVAVDLLVLDGGRVVGHDTRLVVSVHVAQSSGGRSRAACRCRRSSCSSNLRAGVAACKLLLKAISRGPYSLLKSLTTGFTGMLAMASARVSSLIQATSSIITDVQSVSPLYRAADRNSVAFALSSLGHM
jgi:hypothetical protein